MNKEKRLMDIELEIETFHAHLKRLRKKPGSLHRLDVELLQEKTRKLYDKLYDLENLLLGKDELEKIINLPENMPKAEIPATTETKIAVQPQAKRPEEKPQEKPKPEPKVEEKATEEVKPKVEKPKVEVPRPEKQEPIEELKPENKPKPEQQTDTVPEQKTTNVRSTIDLFSDSSEVSIGDKLGGSGDSATIASKMQKSPIQDLKQAIGINEKFLFINELFNGDLGRYNKVIDEFNQLNSQEGTNAHLIELKVQNQWDENNEAYQILKQLLERKFD